MANTTLSKLNTFTCKALLRYNSLDDSETTTPLKKVDHAD